MYTQCVLALLVLYVGSAHSFSWDVVLGNKNGLNFYNNGILTYTEVVPSSEIRSIIYDPVHNRVLFSGSFKNYGSICSYDIATKEIQRLLKCESDIYFRFTYDPVTETLFTITNYGIYTFLSIPGSDSIVEGNLLFELNATAGPPYGIAIDSCGGYIYWTTDYNIERARLDGSSRELIIDERVSWRPDLVIDQQTQKIYWIEERYANQFNLTIISADLNGNNRKTLYTGKTAYNMKTISVSKDFVYWRGNDDDVFWKLSKNPPHQDAMAHTDLCHGCIGITANYKLEDQPKLLIGLMPRISRNITTDVSLLCVHGTKAIGESVCKCTQGYTGKRCHLPICHNYCLHGDCSVNDEQHTCRCNAGYSGVRCEVDVCQGYCLNNGACSLNAENQPVCQCTKDYKGEKCGISVCQSYCIQGNCSVSSEGQPTCSCNAGYSGQRCEVDECHNYCSNNGVCSLNEESDPVCQCTDNYKGDRCDVLVSQGNNSLSGEGQHTSRCDAVTSCERCKVSVCHDYCLNNGVCFLNEDSEPGCQCTGDYEGKRCEVSVSDFLFKCSRTVLTLRDILNTDSNIEKKDVNCPLQSACSLAEHKTY